jgi:ankyrin repeat protein
VLGARAAADLVTAVRTGNLKLLRESINNGAHVEMSLEGDWTPLLLAAHGGHLDLVKELLHRKANIAATSRHGWTALTIASLHGHRNVVRTLLAKRAAVDSRDDQGWTPLMLAAHGGSASVAEDLIAARATAGAVTDTHQTALIVALRRSHDDVVAVLQRELDRCASDVSQTHEDRARKRSQLGRTHGPTLVAANDAGSTSHSNSNNATSHALPSGFVTVGGSSSSGSGASGPVPIIGVGPTPRQLILNENLLSAARRGDLDAVQRLASDGAELTYTGADGMCASELARAAGSRRCRAYLDARRLATEKSLERWTFEDVLLYLEASLPLICSSTHVKAEVAAAGHFTGADLTTPRFHEALHRMHLSQRELTAVQRAVAAITHGFLSAAHAPDSVRRFLRGYERLTSGRNVAGRPEMQALEHEQEEFLEPLAAAVTADAGGPAFPMPLLPVLFRGKAVGPDTEARATPPSFFSAPVTDPLEAPLPAPEGTLGGAVPCVQRHRWWLELPMQLQSVYAPHDPQTLASAAAAAAAAPEDADDDSQSHDDAAAAAASARARARSAIHGRNGGVATHTPGHGARLRRGSATPPATVAAAAVAGSSGLPPSFGRSASLRGLLTPPAATRLRPGTPAGAGAGAGTGSGTGHADDDEDSAAARAGAAAAALRCHAMQQHLARARAAPKKHIFRLRLMCDALWALPLLATQRLLSLQPCDCAHDGFTLRMNDYDIVRVGPYLAYVLWIIGQFGALNGSRLLSHVPPTLEEIEGVALANGDEACSAPLLAEGSHLTSGVAGAGLSVVVSPVASPAGTAGPVATPRRSLTAVGVDPPPALVCSASGVGCSAPGSTRNRACSMVGPGMGDAEPTAEDDAAATAAACKAAAAAKALASVKAAATAVPAGDSLASPAARTAPSPAPSPTARASSATAAPAAASVTPDPEAAVTVDAGADAPPHSSSDGASSSAPALSGACSSPPASARTLTLSTGPSVRGRGSVLGAANSPGDDAPQPVPDLCMGRPGSSSLSLPQPPSPVPGAPESPPPASDSSDFPLGAGDRSGGASPATGTGARAVVLNGPSFPAPVRVVSGRMPDKALRELDLVCSGNAHTLSDEFHRMRGNEAVVDSHLIDDSCAAFKHIFAAEVDWEGQAIECLRVLGLLGAGAGPAAEHVDLRDSVQAAAYFASYEPDVAWSPLAAEADGHHGHGHAYGSAVGGSASASVSMSGARPASGAASAAASPSRAAPSPSADAGADASGVEPCSSFFARSREALFRLLVDANPRMGRWRPPKHTAGLHRVRDREKRRSLWMCARHAKLAAALGDRFVSLAPGETDVQDPDDTEPSVKAKSKCVIM